MDGCENTVGFAIYIGGVDISEPSKEGVTHARKEYKQAIFSNLVP